MNFSTKKCVFLLFNEISSTWKRCNRTMAVDFVRSIDLPKNTAYETVKTFHKKKLDILEDRLEKMEKTREKTHTMLLERITPRLNQLRERICNKNSELMIVGSIATGLTIDSTSDVDLCFVPVKKESLEYLNGFKNNMDFRRIFTQTMINLVTQDKNLWDMKKDKVYSIVNARIPLLKFNFHDGVKFDIQFFIDHTLRNTNLLRHYAMVDSRFRKLNCYVKLLANALRIKDSLKGLLSSYQISLLVAHFLQSYHNKPSILPIIPQVYSSTVSKNLPLNEVMENLKNPIDLSKVSGLINNNISASELVVQFIDYYANFDFTANAIYLDKSHPVRRIQVGINYKLQIFDPYSDYSISRGIYTVEAFSLAMKYVQNSMKDGRYISDFPNFKHSREFLHQIKEKEWFVTKL
uniref:PAP-associated domain-containing protein n=1 Tax=Parastrongyloides trichosuri TaxID=131310 RepID=A0A0N4ZMD6_PARTI